MTTPEAKPSGDADEFAFVREWCEQLVWTAEQGIALLVGLHPNDVKKKIGSAPASGAGLEHRIGERLKALEESSGQAAKERQERLRNYERVRMLWDHLGRTTATPREFCDWAITHGISVPWGDESEAWAKNPYKPRETSRKMLTIIAGLCELAKVDPQTTKGLANKIMKACARQGLSIDEGTVKKYMDQLADLLSKRKN